MLHQLIAGPFGIIWGFLKDFRASVQISVLHHHVLQHLIPRIHQSMHDSEINTKYQNLSFEFSLFCTSPPIYASLQFMVLNVTAYVLNITCVGWVVAHLLNAALVQIRTDERARCSVVAAILMGVSEQHVEKVKGQQGTWSQGSATVHIHVYRVDALNIDD